MPALHPLFLLLSQSLQCTYGWGRTSSHTLLKVCFQSIGVFLEVKWPFDLQVHESCLAFLGCIYRKGTSTNPSEFSLIFNWSLVPEVAKTILNCVTLSRSLVSITCRLPPNILVGSNWLGWPFLDAFNYRTCYFSTHLTLSLTRFNLSPSARLKYLSNNHWM